MNPYLKAQRTKYDTIRSEVDEVQTRAVDEGRDLTEDEMRSITEKAEELRTISENIEHLTDLEERTRAVQEMSARVGGMGEGGGFRADDPLAPYSLMPSRDQLTQIRSALSEGRDIRLTTPRAGHADLHTRAVVELADVGAEVGAGHGRLPEPRRIVTAVGLVPEPVGSGGVSGPRFGATAGAAPTTEGLTKPEADAITKLDIVPQALARWTDTSRHALLSQSGYLDQLVSWHAQFIAKDEDLMIVTALAAIAGTPIDGSADAGAGVRTGIARVTDAASADADIVVCHPDDYAQVSAFSPSSGSDVESFAARIGTALIYPTSAATVGTVHVAALRAGGRFLVAMPPQVAALENLKDNVTTVRTEEVAGFGVRLVGSVAAVSLTAAG